MITVTDHALVRYLEREKGFDLEPFRAEILGAAKLAAALKAATVKVGACVFVLRHCGGADYAVVTALPKPNATKLKGERNKREYGKFIRRQNN